MKNTGHGLGGGLSKARGYMPDNDWEAAEEISPDPFSEEQHTRIHARRFARGENEKRQKSEENRQNNEQVGDNLG